MEEFSTFDVSRLFDIDRTRLQEWIDRGFFTPFRKAAGKGTKAVFTRDDLYRLRLFMWLLLWLDSRSRVTHTLSNVNFQNVGPGKEQYKYLSLKVPMGKGASGGSFELLREMPRSKMEISDFFLMVINLEAIKADVDRLLGK